MMRILDRLFRLYENYRHYRQMGIDSQQAWQLAKLTLPE